MGAWVLAGNQRYVVEQQKFSGPDRALAGFLTRLVAAKSFTPDMGDLDHAAAIYVAGEFGFSYGVEGVGDREIVKSTGGSGVRLKHLAGKHDQKRHGYRYGTLAGMRRSLRGREAAEREEYRRRAASRGLDVPEKPAKIEKKPALTQVTIAQKIRDASRAGREAAAARRQALMDERMKEADEFRRKMINDLVVNSNSPVAQALVSQALRRGSRDASVIENLQNAKISEYAAARDMEMVSKVHQALFTYVGNKKAKIAANISTDLPDSLQHRSQEGVEFYRKIVSSKASGRRAENVNIVANTSGRACYADWVKQVRLNNGSSVQTVAHELGHHLEYHGRGIKRLATSFLKSRTKGERAKKLSDLVRSSGYGPDERARPDKFVNPYIGKLYQDNATEVISMGMGYLYNSPLFLALNDPGHFNLMLTVLKYGGS